MLEKEKEEAINKAKERYENINKYSPMMQNYIATKYKYVDCILCYRLGDFFEMFFEDAIICSRELELTLTGKDCGVEERAPMCGIPHHAVDSYISKLIEKNYKVAICEQLEDPKKAKGIVKRDVIKVVTPGTSMVGNFVEEKRNNYIMSIYKESLYFGIAVADISTADFYVTEIKQENNFAKLLNEISRYNPSEIIVNKMMNACKDEMQTIKSKFNAYITIESDKETENDETDNSDIDADNINKDAYMIVNNEPKKSWKTSDGINFSNDLHNIKETLEIYDSENHKVDIEKKSFAICAINGLMNYIKDTQKQIPENIKKVIYYEPSKYMSLDLNARRNLEITEKMRDKSKKGTLLWVLDNTCTSMGGRLLRRWISDPLLDTNDINDRLDAVEEIKNKTILRDDIINSLKNVYDIERITGKISYGTANARDLISLKNSISQLPDLKETLKNVESKLLRELYESLDTLDDLYQLINNSIVDDPPITVKEGGIIKEGYNSTIDRLVEISKNGKAYLSNVEAEERERTGIKNLKIGYNKIFGYYIEVSKSFTKMVPKDRYITKQTLTTGERYITEELKEKENEILGANEKVVNLEYDEFVNIRNQIEQNSKRLQISSSVVAKIDVLCSLAITANDMNYCKPVVDESNVIDIQNGRHPVVEKILDSGSFIPNDAYLDTENNRLNIITGPNMAGKSTYMRQVALITSMAQIGSFVPAESAHIGVCDKIFTRVGASDDLAMRRKYVYD